MGHIRHFELLRLDDPGDLQAGGNCASNVHFFSGLQPNEKCVTSEGFADFVAGRTWWNQNAVQPLYRDWALEGDTGAGNHGIKRCVSIDDQPHKRVGNAARFFWDLYDSTPAGTNGANDDEVLSFGAIENIWEEFDEGTANRQTEEIGGNGRNAEDFLVNAPGENFTGERGLSCLDAQAN